MNTKNQETLAPTRKVWASFVATVVIAGVCAGVDFFVPGASGLIPVDTATVLVTGALTTFASYIAREWG